MECNQKLMDLVRGVACHCFAAGAAMGQKHAELLDEKAIEEMAEVFAAEFEIAAMGALWQS